MPDHHSPEYVAHLKSDAWRATRMRILARARGVCEECGTARATQVHHLTYERLGREVDTDLQALCPHCHALADDKREQAAPRRAYERAFETYAMKRWGEDAFYDNDYDSMRDEFDAWLDRQDYGQW